MKLRALRKDLQTAFVVPFLLLSKGLGAHSKMNAAFSQSRALLSPKPPTIFLLAFLRVICMAAIGVRSTVEQIQAKVPADFDIEGVWSNLHEENLLQHDYKLAHDMRLSEQQQVEFVVRRMTQRERGYRDYQGLGNFKFRNIHDVIAYRQKKLQKLFAHHPEDVVATLLRMSYTSAKSRVFEQRGKVINVFKQIDRLIRKRIKTVNTSVKPLLLSDSNYLDHFNNCSIEDIYYIAQAIHNIKRAIALALRDKEGSYLYNATSFNEESLFRDIITQESKQLAMLSHNTAMMHAFHHQLTIALEQVRLLKIKTKNVYEYTTWINKSYQVDAAYLEQLRQLAQYHRAMMLVAKKDNYDDLNEPQDLSLANYAKDHGFIDDTKNFIAAVKASVNIGKARYCLTPDAERYGVSLEGIKFDSIKHQVPEFYTQNILGPAQRIAIVCGYIVGHAGTIFLFYTGVWGVFVKPPANNFLRDLTYIITIGGIPANGFMSYYFGTRRIVQCFSEIGETIDLQYLFHRRLNSKLEAVVLTIGTMLQSMGNKLISVPGFIAVLLNIITTPLTIDMVKGITRSLLYLHLGVSLTTSISIASTLAIAIAVLTGISGVLINYAQVKGSADEITWVQLFEKYSDAYNEKKYVAVVASVVIGLCSVATTALASAAGDNFALFKLFPGASGLCLFLAAISYLCNFSISLKQTMDGTCNVMTRASDQFVETISPNKPKPPESKKLAWHIESRSPLAETVFFSNTRLLRKDYEARKSDDVRTIMAPGIRSRSGLFRPVPSLARQTGMSYSPALVVA